MGSARSHQNGKRMASSGARCAQHGGRFAVCSLFVFTDLKQPDKVIAKPGGYFIAPEGEERIGDVSM